MSDKKTILVVEGEEYIRHQLFSILEESFEVLLATDGREAVARYEDHADRIAAVITECEMPRLNGVDLTVWLHQKDPELPVIMITGSLKGKNFGPLVGLPKFILLWKPFDVEQLIELLTAYTVGPSLSTAVK